jgi:hypothetical protein
MAYEQRDLSGSLFKNEKREKDTHPNLTGTVMIGGVEYWASGWTKERSNGEKWISLSFKPKERAPADKARGYSGSYTGDPRTNGGGGTIRPAAFDTNLDDDVPFISCDPWLEGRCR